jgi:hypothetical protein
LASSFVVPNIQGFGVNRECMIMANGCSGKMGKSESESTLGAKATFCRAPVSGYKNIITIFNK